MSAVIPVILAGGVGSRLWPLSRDLYPKQLLSLIGEQSLLQATVARALQIPATNHVIVVCNQQYQFLVKEQLEALQAIHPITFDLILEPVGRNTAPALALASKRVMELDPNALLLALPADHLIGNAATFAEQLAQITPHTKNKLVTFGVKPSYPETGYGYIEADHTASTQVVYPIKRFVEKPNRETAEGYYASGNYYWNSGIFLYTPATYLAELKQYMPDVLDVCKQVWTQKASQAESIYLDPARYATCPDISIDYAVMEKTTHALMAPLQTTWDDVGSWLAVSKIEPPDAQGNVCLGDVVALDSENCYLRSESRLVAVVGLKDHIVVETPDAILVASKASAQHVKHLAQHLKTQKRKEAESHSVLYHPWGRYEIVCEGQGFVVKQITIKSGGMLSALVEENTCEHWVVLSGVAHVFIDGMSSLFSANQFVDMLSSTQYRIQNESTAPLKLLNIQTVNKNI